MAMKTSRLMSIINTSVRSIRSGSAIVESSEDTRRRMAMATIPLVSTIRTFVGSTKVW
jgi:hypothetical protein